MKQIIVAGVLSLFVFTGVSDAFDGPVRRLVRRVVSVRPVQRVVEAQPVRSVVRPVRSGVSRVRNCLNGSCGG